MATEQVVGFTIGRVKEALDLDMVKRKRKRPNRAARTY